MVTLEQLVVLSNLEMAENKKTMAKNVSSIKHKGNTRPHIPSMEETGYEDANGSKKGSE